MYDGSKVFIYKSALGNDNINWYNAVEQLYEDSDNNIWIGTRGGLVSCFNPGRQSFKQYETEPRVMRITGFAEDDTHRIWIGYDNGYIGYICGDSICKKKVIESKVVFMHSISHGRLLIVGESGLTYYNTVNNTTEPIIIESRKYNVIENACVSGNKLIITGWDGIDIIDLQNKKIIKHFPRIDPGRKAINNICPSQTGGFCYTDATNIKEYDSEGNLKYVYRISNNKWYDQHEYVNCILADNRGLIWIGTNSGLLKLDTKKYLFKKYTRNSIDNKLSDDYIRAIHAEGNNYVWVGYRAGSINKLTRDSINGNIKEYAQYPLLLNGRKIDNYTTNTILPLDDGRILAGGQNGLFVLDKKGKEFVHFPKKDYPDTLIEVWSLYRDSQKRIWVGTNHFGLFIIDEPNSKVYHYSLKAITKKDGADNIWNIYCDRNKKIWIGTDNGLFQVADPKDITALHFNEFILKPKEQVYVWNIAEDNTGNIWIGTTGNGIFKISVPDYQVSTPVKLPLNSISAIVADKADNIWVSTVNGLFRYNEAKNKISSFDEEDGIISNDFNYNSFSIAPSGEIYMGTKTGMISFKPETIYERDYHSVPTHITYLNIAGNDSTAAIYNKVPLELSRIQNFITIGFSIADFSKTIKHRYRYILEGFDNKWNYTQGERPVATYTNLPPGKYKFIVEGSADGIQWSIKNAVLYININPAIWQRPIFWITCIIMVLIAAGIIIYKRINAVVNKEREKNRIEKQIAELELKALQAQMNPHFIFNTINAIQHFIIEKDEITANDYLSKFARLMRLFLESSKNKYISLHAEIELLQLYISLEKLRFYDKFDYTIDFEDIWDTKNIMIPSMLIQPFAENAINHGLVPKDSDGHLDIKFRLINAETLCCIIDDDGIGRKKAAELGASKNKRHISRGMQLIEERIKTYNFITDGNILINITDKQPPYVGTLIEIIIPIDPNNK